MTEALNGGGGRRTRLGESTCVLEAPPPSVYKGWRAGQPLWVRQGRERGVLLGLQVLVGFPLGRGKEGREREKEKGVLRPPNPLSNSDQQGEGRSSPCGLLLSFPYGPIRPITSPGGFGTPPALRKIPESLGTFPTSEYSLPIYESLPLGHSETPRHVRDLIRDSELPSVTHHITHIILYHHRTLSVRTLRVRE